LSFSSSAAHAVAFHGHPRFTGDIDFLIRASVQNATQLLNALRVFGFGNLSLSVNDFIKPGNVIQLGRPPNRIDLLTSISGVEFDDAWSSRVQAELDDLPVCFLGWKSLIENKQASGRPKDLADVAKLKAVAAARPPG
jgi:hypothetical protein